MNRARQRMFLLKKNVLQSGMELSAAPLVKPHPSMKASLCQRYIPVLLITRLCEIFLLPVSPASRLTITSRLISTSSS